MSKNTFEYLNKENGKAKNVKTAWSIVLKTADFLDIKPTFVAKKAQGQAFVRAFAAIELEDFDAPTATLHMKASYDLLDCPNAGYVHVTDKSGQVDLSDTAGNVDGWCSVAADFGRLHTVPLQGQHTRDNKRELSFYQKAQAEALLHKSIGLLLSRPYKVLIAYETGRDDKPWDWRAYASEILDALSNPMLAREKRAQKYSGHAAMNQILATDKKLAPEIVQISASGTFELLIGTTDDKVVDMFSLPGQRYTFYLKSGAKAPMKPYWNPELTSSQEFWSKLSAGGAKIALS